MSGDVLQEQNHRRWRALTLLAVTLVLSMTPWFSAAAVIPQLRAEWALSVSAAAWLTIAVQIGFVCGALVSSLLNLSDVVPPKHMILGGAVGAATANGLLEVASGAGVGIALRFATGFFLAGVYPPALKLMCTWFREGRGIALGILVGAIVVGQAMPPTGCEFRLKRSGCGQRNRQAGETSRVEMGDEAVLRCRGYISAG